MATKVVDECKLFAHEFILIARNLTTRGESLWRREEEPDRTFSDSEAIQWLQQTEGKKR